MNIDKELLTLYISIEKMFNERISQLNKELLGADSNGLQQRLEEINCIRAKINILFDDCVDMMK